MYRFKLAETGQGQEIYVNLISSSAGKYISRRPYVYALVKELMRDKSFSKKQTIIEQDMGRAIGTSDIVTTTSTDTIYYARALKSETFSRFAKNRDPQTSTVLTAIVEEDTEGNFEVRDTWIGTYYPPFPGDANESAHSKDYWLTHAMVHEAQAVQSKSVTKDCPYQ